MEQFRLRLREFMKERGMNQKDLIALTGFSKSGISQYLSGAQKIPEKSQEHIADVLGLPIGWFFTTDSPPDAFEIAVRNYKVNLAAKALGQSPKILHQTLQQGRVNWGYATETGFDSYCYHISQKGLADYLRCDWRELPIS